MSMWLRVALSLPLLAFAAPAQNAGVIDEGTFTFTRAGAPFGTESFRIVRRLGSGGHEFAAQATRTMEGRIIRTNFVADSAANPSSYSRDVSGPASSQLTARRALNRLTVNEDRGSSRDYVFTPGSVILDEDVIHLLYFVTWRGPRQLGYVVPGGRAAGQARLTEVGRENLSIGGESIAATRFSLGSGDDRREIWIDSSRRLLKVTHPSRQLIGIRDLPPR